MKSSARFLCLGLTLIVLGLCGFAYFWGAHDRSLVEERSGTGPLISCGLEAESGHVYEVSLSAVDSAGLPWNRVDVEASVLFNGEAVHSESLSASEFPGKSAREGFVFRADVRQDGLLEVDGFMREGERWTVSVYRDLPPFLGVGPFVCAVVGLLGLVCVVQSGEV
jgi:hypothetical protein